MSAAIDVTAVAALAARARSAARAPGPPVTRVEVAGTVADPIAWLRERPAGQRYYWRGRDSPNVVAAAGCAASVDFADIGQAAVEMRGPVAGLPPRGAFLLASRFDPERAVSPEWHDFGRVRFVLPRFELARGRSGVRLSCNVTDADRDDLAVLDEALGSLIERASGDGLPGPATALPNGIGRERVDQPDRAAWGVMIENALRSFDGPSLRKVVLARRSTWELAERLDPITALGRIVSRASRSYHVLVESGASAFLSATPERLVRLDGRRVSTEAVAGTRPNGEQLDEGFSDKDHLEHSLVVDDVRERLGPLVAQINADDSATELVLPRRRHLRTRIEATRRPGATVLDVVAALHPTPAVGGTPRESARAFIEDAEPFDRGLYAGVVGRVGKDGSGAECGEFAVGIRSALVEDRTISLYAGAGIVPGSVTDEEWREVDGKMSDLALALGLP